MRLLDLCCGLGGWSRGFADEGYECIGIDIVDVGYPYKLILKDIRELNGNDYRGYDVIVGSTPCRDFSRTTSFGKKYWKDPPNPERGKELIQHFLRIVNEANPKFWLLENVPQARNYVPLKPQCIARFSKTMVRALWGNFPAFLIPETDEGRLKQDIHGRLRSWKRAEIPYETSRALARIIKQESAN